MPGLKAAITRCGGPGTVLLVGRGVGVSTECGGCMDGLRYAGWVRLDWSSR